MDLKGTWKSQKMHGRKLIWKEPGSLNIKWKEIDMEGTWKSCYYMEGN